MSKSLLEKIKNNEIIYSSDAMKEVDCLRVVNAGFQYKNLVKKIENEKDRKETI